MNQPLQNVLLDFKPSKLKKRAKKSEWELNWFTKISGLQGFHGLKQYVGRMAKSRWSYARSTLT
jgi:hypothetical protein